MNHTELPSLLSQNSDISSFNSTENHELNVDLSSNNQLVIIDSSVENYQLLIDNFVEQTEVVILNDRQDGIFQITEALSQYDDLNAVHIVSHGNNGELFLGNSVLNQNTLSEYKDELEDWGNAIEEEGDLLLYGCNVAADLTGAKFVEELSEYTQADIQASNNVTGSNEFGGDWDLEYATGDVETTLIFDSEINSVYQHSLQSSLRDVFVRDNKIVVTYERDGDDDFREFDSFLDRELFGGGGDDDDEVNVREFDNFASIPASDLVILAENGLNFAQVNLDILATVDFNNIPAEDFQILRGAGLSLTPLTTEALGNINLGVFKNFDYLSQVDLSQTRFNSLTTFRDLSAAFVANANLYDYKAELEIGQGLDLNKLSQLSFIDFRAINYAFDGDEIFDSVHYRNQRDTAGTNPFADYMENGWRDGVNPHPLFDVSYYLAKNTDVQGAGDEPLTHYITKGFAEADNANRDPHPLFDTSYYNENNTDVVDANKNSLLHFVESGFSENFDSRDPNRFFDSSYYNVNNPDVVAAGVNPLVHYIQFGWRESLNGTNPNRDPNPLFDTEFYFETHEDVRFEVLSNDNGSPYQYISANPLQHYIEFGDEGTIAIDERVTHPTSDAENVSRLSVFLDAQSEGFEYAKFEFNKLDIDLTPLDNGDILVSGVGFLIPYVVPVIKFLVVAGTSYELFNTGSELSEDIQKIFRVNTDTAIYTSLSISTNDSVVDIGTPPFDDVIESTIEVETVPKGTTSDQILDDSQFYTPLEPIDELAQNVETFPRRDRIIEDLLNDGLFVGGEEAPSSNFFYASQANVTIQNPEEADFATEVFEAIRLAELEGGGNIRFLGNNSQGIEGYFTPSGQTKEIPFSLKAYNGTGKFRNIIRRLNDNATSIQDEGITDPVLLRVEMNQFTAEELETFINIGPVKNYPFEGVFGKIYFDGSNGTVVVDTTGVYIVR